MSVNAELAAALEAAIAEFKRLGAIVEDVTLQPLQTYSDVKIVTAESELFSLHLPELQKRPEAFGQDFRARALAACLFTAEDYVRASRLRRLMLDEMRPLYRKFDLFLTANGSPAPRLDQHNTMAFWQKGNFTTPFNCTGGPALSVLSGFTKDGLPLSMQIAGRPFDDALVLRAGHAFEQATGYWKKRSSLIAGAKPAALDPKPWVPSTTDVPADIRATAIASAQRAGLKLPEPIMDELVAVAPFAIAMAKRLQGGLAREAETSAVFDPIRDVD